MGEKNEAGSGQASRLGEIYDPIWVQPLYCFFLSPFVL